MRQHHEFKNHFLKAALFCGLIFSAGFGSLQAQTYTFYGSGNPIDLTLATGGTTFSDVNTLECETMELSSGAILSATAWDGTPNSGLVGCGFNVSVTGVGSDVVTLPTGSTHPDITIGYDGTDYWVAVIYENNDDILLNTYTVNLSTSAATFQAQHTMITSVFPYTYDHPSIDVFSDATNTNYMDFMTSWDENDGSGNYILYTCAGNIGSGATATPVTAFSCGNTAGRSDIACVTDVLGMQHYYVVFQEWIYPNLYLWVLGREYAWPHNLVTLNNFATSSVSLASPPHFVLPRIAAQTLYDDLSGTTTCEAVYTIAYNSVTGTGYNNVYSLSYFPSTCATIGGGTIDFTAYNAGAREMFPCLTMPGTFAGSITSNIGNNMAALGFYSRDVSTQPYNGQYMMSGIDYATGGQIRTTYPDIDIWGINNAPLNSPMAFWAPSQNPAMAISSAQNSGKEMYATWFDGGSNGNIMYKFGGNSTASPAFKTTAIVNVNKQKEYGIYPNPATDIVFVSGVSKGEYKVLDITGRLVAEGQLSAQANTVSVGSLSSGAYMLLITEDGLTQQFKFTKQ